MKDGKAWIGDEVFDEDAQETGIVTDVRDGLYLLRPLGGGGPEWQAPRPDRLKVTVPREERAW
ncbi:hypothetical protein [Streptomyces griseoaurantiacus]|uniref:Uncharacterized protein n=1 Tax=Streptomyces griseoaurantiacus TaxID=68213 RepID=A0A7W2DSK8_9ACTN|nr:hypothetical protein [Streptomyces griseoaurantiacus]MBA5222207.1 hypothetical protein [Streptomyces griseoaurantiacus]